MRILVTRPRGKGELLVKQLGELAEYVHFQPVIEIVPGPDVANFADKLCAEKPDILIFVSGFAVEHFISALGSPISLDSDHTQLMAVGKSTADKLADWSKQTILYPQLETSEGLLSMAQLQTAMVKGRRIVIVRGVGGRELLAGELTSRGATTDYWQLYHRRVIDDQGLTWYDQWKSQRINCIVITSVSILTALFDSLPSTAHQWLISRQWIVASRRIGDKARELGIAATQIYDAQGATNSAVLAQVKRLVEN
jgi:uroporphyrinogen-III synthase